MARLVESESKTSRDAEAAASRIVATETALKPISPSNTWWPKTSLWPKAADKSQDTTNQTQNHNNNGSGT